MRAYGERETAANTMRGPKGVDREDLLMLLLLSLLLLSLLLLSLLLLLLLL